FSSRRRHTRFSRDWSSDVCSSDLDGRWVGLGSCDMKGFFALVIEAVQPLLEQGFQQPLLILATCDEESSMAGARALADAGRPLRSEERRVGNGCRSRWATGDATNM